MKGRDMESLCASSGAMFTCSRDKELVTVISTVSCTNGWA